MRQIQQTSIESYYSILPHLGDDEQTALIAIHGTPDQTDREYADLLGFKDPNKFRPRRNELVRIGLVVCSGKRRCKITKKRAMTWRVKQK